MCRQRSQGDITRFVDARTVEEFHREAGEAALVVAKEKLASSASLAHSAHILIGEAAPINVKFAMDKGCNLFIMGAHGFGSVIGLVMGSFTNKVIHRAHLAVLLVK